MAQRAALKSRSRDDDDRDDERPRSGGLKRSSRGSSGRGGGTKWGGYQERTREQVKARAEQTGGKFDSYLMQGIEMYRAKDGENTIRYLPPTWSPAEHYGYDVWVHGFIGTDGSSFLCLDKMKKERCPICVAAKEAKDAGDDEEAKQLSATKRVITWVLDRDENIGKDGPTPKVYSQSWSFDRDIAALCDTKKGAILIDHPEEGYDVSFRKKGKALATRYIGVQIDRDPSPICEDEDDQAKVLAYIEENPLPDTLKFYSAEHLQKVIEGSVEPKDEDLDDDKDEKPRRGRRDKDEEEDERPARRRTRERDRDEEEEDEPRGRTHRGRDDESRSRSRSTRDDREEDERPSRSRRDKDEEDEPDERPRRTRSRDAEDDERPARRRSRDEDEDKPSRTRGRASSRDEVDEPEPDEEDAVEEGVEEEDERPTRRRSRR